MAGFAPTIVTALGGVKEGGWVVISVFTAVIAAQAGVVTSAGWRNNGGGNVISVDHGNGMVTVLVDPLGHCAPLFRLPPATS